MLRGPLTAGSAPRSINYYDLAGAGNNLNSLQDFFPDRIGAEYLRLWRLRPGDIPGAKSGFQYLVYGLDNGFRLGPHPEGNIQEQGGR